MNRSSSMQDADVGHLVRDEGVAGSNPATPTRNRPRNQLFRKPSINTDVLPGQVPGQA
jgi:hypothetical protein